MRLRFSIGAAMVLVLAVAVGVAALRYADALVASITFSATVLVSGVAALGTAFSRGPRRAFYTGFAAFGFGYLSLCYGPFAYTEIRPHLATAKLLSYSAGHLHRGVIPATPATTRLAADNDRDGVTDAVWIDLGFPARRASDGTLFKPLTLMQVGHSESFERVGHSLFALLFGLLGGLVARHFAARSEREAATVPQKD